MIDKASEEQLKNSIDIVDIISNYIEIKKSGANFKANCPFHNEKTPSFVVSPTKQIYHCFSCGAGGDAIEFVKEYEKLSYPEALEKIASIMNFSLVYTKGGSSNSNTRRVLEQVQNWYRQNLNSSPMAKDYLNRRGINGDSIDRFGIGFVGSSKELLDFLSSNFLSLTEAKEAGVVNSDENNRYYARLTQRVTFPIYSISGAIVGFGGRTLTNHPAKYINSPQTKLFNKSQLLYGYSKAKEHIYKKREIIICEGYLDVILFHQAGFNTAVATLGTALTTEHIPILKKGNPKIILAYDGDKAGVDAGLKASTLLSRRGFEGRVVLFPNGADPADMISSGRAEEVRELLKEGQDFVKFVIENIANSYDLKNPYRKEEAFREIKEYLNSLTPIVRNENIPHSATLLDISPSLFTSSRKLDKSSRVAVDSSKDNIGLLNIIKSVAENEKFIKKLLKVVDVKLFKEYAPLLKMAINRDINNPNLVGLILDDNYKSLDEKSFEKELIDLIKILYIQKYKSIIRDNSISYIEKQHIVHKIKMDILPRLNRGELIPFNI